MSHAKRKTCLITDTFSRAVLVIPIYGPRPVPTKTVAVKLDSSYSCRSFSQATAAPPEDTHAYVIIPCFTITLYILSIHLFPYASGVPLVKSNFSATPVDNLSDVETQSDKDDVVRCVDFQKFGRIHFFPCPTEPEFNLTSRKLHNCVGVTPLVREHCDPFVMVISHAKDGLIARILSFEVE